MWYHALTGFHEHSAPQVRSNLTLDGEWITSQANHRRMRCGRLEIPSLAELRDRVSRVAPSGESTTVREIIADVRDLHSDAAQAGALFQVASQFNLLEMTGPDLTPEDGIDRYERDRTQGPACAIACGAGTIYRNYLVPIGDQIGQTAGCQIDCLRDLGTALGNDDGSLWIMRNGYALATTDGLETIAKRLGDSTELDRDRLRALIRIGIQWDTEVTIADTRHAVSQVYASALPVTYSHAPAEAWEAFARLVLEAAYEATLLAGVLNAASNGDRRVNLTLLGGGVFGNPVEWIVDGMRWGLERVRGRGLEVAVISYNRPNPELRSLGF